jgi:hypothetical protein
MCDVDSFSFFLKTKQPGHLMTRVLFSYSYFCIVDVFTQENQKDSQTMLD